ncbi:uncharacterized protein B0P05DRAFT_566679 [Gilbertella persicaria]|uniref:uncharacterized protein n=1 Tax=Gilbertella persicaria TaxID=101096 RepID=UPI00221EE809|nr:uncharacterized protein B0P05DRAFT_566679 [Gilbertella persicaria]KAI8047191.1 hypothetical protein B0P05DRAFT_566679 [Gilbertella persicaria]
MSQLTSPSISRAPVSVRKMAHILKEPFILSSIATVGALVLGVGSWYYLTRQPTRILERHAIKEFKLVEKIPVNHNTNRYRFALPRKTDLLGLPIGQHVTLVANVNGVEVSRSYTPTSSDQDKGFFELIVKTYPNGLMSQHLNNLNIGDKIAVKGPKGAFSYTPNMAREIGMVAGGTGITPMYQIIAAILRNPNDKTKISLIFGNVTKSDILLESELEALAAKHPDQFTIYHVLNEAPDENWNQGVGFITKDILAERLSKCANDVKILVCGPPPLVKAVTNATTELGYEPPRTVSKLTDQVFKF